MKTKEQGIAIAEKLGAYWTITREGYGYPVNILVAHGYRPPESWDDSPGMVPCEQPRLVHCSVPDYPTDLNAIRVAKETVLRDDDTCRKYLETLAEIVIRDISAEGPEWKRRISTNYHVTNASAAQECEALCKVLGIWEEGSGGE